MFSSLTEREIIISATFILSSANAFDLGLSYILQFGNALTLYHTTPTFIEPTEKALENTWKKRKCW